MIIQWN